VRTVSGPRGRDRIWYDLGEIEQIAATTLRAAGLWPEPEVRSVDVEWLVETHLGASIDYAARLPTNVLGKTEFRSPPHVEISRELTDLATAEAASLGLRGRWRATIAHEAAHILLHAPLFAEAIASRQLVSCHRETIEVPSARHDWIEVQANMGMVALLMPRSPFLHEARRLLESRGAVIPPLGWGSSIATELVNRLAETFETSLQATRLRLLTFGFLSDAETTPFA
jgi:hypothetical protein